MPVTCCSGEKQTKRARRWSRWRLGYDTKQLRHPPTRVRTRDPQPTLVTLVVRVVGTYINCAASIFENGGKPQRPKDRATVRFREGGQGRHTTQMGRLQSFDNELASDQSFAVDTLPALIWDLPAVQFIRDNAECRGEVEEGAGGIDIGHAPRPAPRRSTPGYLLGCDEHPSPVRAASPAPATHHCRHADMRARCSDRRICLLLGLRQPASSSRQKAAHVRAIVDHRGVLLLRQTSLPHTSQPGRARRANSSIRRTLPYRRSRRSAASAGFSL